MDTARIVPLTEIGDPARLRALAEAIFGAQGRPKGWFARKLRRECVDARLSRVAHVPGAAAGDPRHWLGYVLVGTPPSLGAAARTAGVGVLGSARRRGIARGLLDAAAAAAQRSGHSQLQLLSAPDLVELYAKQGFGAHRRLVTLSRPSTGPRSTRMPLAEPWGAAPPRATVVAQWLPEAWAGSDAPHTTTPLRHTVRTQDVLAHVSWEGRALLVHRLVTEAGNDAVHAAATLLRCLPTGHPVLLPLMPEVSTVTEALLAAGWHAIQRGTMLHRELHGSLPAPPARR